jgi:hypothetical protein
MAIIRLARRYNFNLHPGKLQGPSRTMTFLGIVFDSVSMTLSIPPQKLADALACFKTLAKKKKWVFRDIQSVVGKCFHFSRVLPAARGAMSRFFTEMHSHNRLRHSSQSFAPSAEVLKDLKAWIALLPLWTGISPLGMLAGLDPSFTPGLTFELDASPTGGCAAWCPKLRLFMYHALSPAQLAAATPNVTSSSTIIEGLTVVYLLCAFQDIIKGTTVHICLDCEPALKNFRKGYSSGSDKLSELFRLSSALQILFSCTLTFSHLPRLSNKVADALSRGNLEEFHGLTSDGDSSKRASRQATRSVPPLLLPQPQLLSY